MDDNACPVCGGVEFTPSGKCRKCARDYMRQYRAEKRGGKPGKVGRPKKTMPMGDASTATTGDAITDPRKRIEYMLARHQRTLDQFDWQLNELADRIKDAQENGEIRDYTKFLEMHGKTLALSAQYDMKMSAELQLWREVLGAEKEAKPINFICYQLEASQFIKNPPKIDLETGTVTEVDTQ